MEANKNGLPVTCWLLTKQKCNSQQLGDTQYMCVDGRWLMMMNEIDRAYCIILELTKHINMPLKHTLNYKINIFFCS